MKRKYMCNHHFIAECHDINPHPETTECSGVDTEEESKGACEAWINKHGCSVKCENKEHPENCKRNDVCENCGIRTCSPNFAYHVCVKKR